MVCVAILLLVVLLYLLAFGLFYVLFVALEPVTPW